MHGALSELGARAEERSSAAAVAAAGAAAVWLVVEHLPAAVELDPAAGTQELAQLRAPALDARLHAGHGQPERCRRVRLRLRAEVGEADGAAVGLGESFDHRLQAGGDLHSQVIGL